MKIKKLLLQSLMIIIVLLISGCNKNKSNVIKMAEVAHSIFYAPQYIALTEGYFTDEELEIELYNANGADKVTAALLSGDIDIGLQGPEPTIYLYNQNKDNYLVNFMQLTQRDGSFIMAREKIDNFNIEMLKGKSILGGRAGGVPEMTLEYVIKNAGLSLAKNSTECDVNVRTDVQFSAMSGAFISGEGDFTTLFEPNCTELELQNKGFVVASVGELAGEIPYTAYSTTVKYLNNNQEKLEKFIRAIYRGQQFIKNNDDETIAKVLNKTFKEQSIESLTIIVKRYREIDAWCSTPYFKQEGFEKLMDIMELAGELSKRVSFDVLVDNSIANKIILSQ